MANTNTFQIIGGEHRGRKLQFPDASGLRPTPGKVRETLFNWIQFECYNKSYLDLFAGSGALSFEAFSRGANQVIGFEKNPKVYQILEKNRKLFKSDKIQLINQDAFEFLSQSSDKTYDFVFLDPPFNQDLIIKALKLLKNGNFITHKSKIYIESEFQIDQDFLAPIFSQKIKINKQKRAGAVHYALLELL